MTKIKSYIHENKETVTVALILIAFFFYVGFSLYQRPDIQVENDRIEAQEYYKYLKTLDGKPDLVKSEYVDGHTHNTYCQLLPFKKDIGQGDVNCYVHIVKGDTANE